MKRRSFVRGLLGLTGLAASGISLSSTVKPKIYTFTSKPINADFPFKEYIPNFGPESGVKYNTGDLVMSNGHIYKCTGSNGRLKITKIETTQRG